MFGNEKKKYAKLHTETLYNNGIDAETEIYIRDVEVGEVCACSTCRRVENNNIRSLNILVVILYFM